ncbi:hypothetical protein TRVL_07260 [Trypanosoma vivax]|uniref:Uncharacterized protein n=1 Tax=Trypanosoma vivax (strain Y486) TaxID=1055687 RepID=G0U3U8_TRYVY|nr:hypothetical protein TRVL_07260 [Trypanosoma vivax]CCC50188.1 conserved hypothetical protein [Trypanosoma vivax Y486]
MYLRGLCSAASFTPLPIASHFSLQVPKFLVPAESLLLLEMDLRSLVKKQMLRQATLQPGLKLPAGRVVSMEEGRRLARLVNDEEARVASACEKAVAEQQSAVPVVLEETVSKRILLIRQRANKEANIKAAVAHAKKQQASNPLSRSAPEVRDIALKLLQKDQGAQAVLNARKVRGGAQKATRHLSK